MARFTGFGGRCRTGCHHKEIAPEKVVLNFEMMRKISGAPVTLLLVALFCRSILSAANGNLTFYFVDVEGGAATLIVTPGGESMLADTGNPTPDDRDAKRIFQAAQAAGLTKIDYLLITHYDGDHVGGAPALAKLIPIEHFLDHGDSSQTNSPQGARLWEGYKSISEGKRRSLKAGERVPLKGVQVQIVSSNGEVIAKAINGGKANPLCAGAQNKGLDPTENAFSLGFLLTYGKFKFLDVGDLTWSKEMELACPVDKLGMVTVFQATHHGFQNDRSGAPALVFAIQPQVVVVNNGPRKGLGVQEGYASLDGAPLPATTDIYERIAKIPGIEDIWQGHLALANDKNHNTDERMIANLEPTADCKGNWIRIVVQSNGAFTITNGRNNFSKSYVALAR